MRRIKNTLSNLLVGKYPVGLFFTATTSLIYTPLFLLYSDTKSASVFTLMSFSGIFIFILTLLLMSYLAKLFLPKFNIFFDGIMTGVALYLLLTAIFYPVESGIMDGSDIVIPQSDKYLHLSLLLICILTPLVGIYKTNVRAACRKGVVLLGIFSLLASVYMGIAVLSLNGNHDLEVQWEKSTALSDKHNIIVIGLDALQGSLVNEILQNDAKLSSLFDGFTSFTNVSSIFPGTGFSYRGILEDAIPQGPVKAINSRSNLIVDMHNAGYDVSLGDNIDKMFNGVLAKETSAQIVPSLSVANSISDDTISLFLLGQDDICLL